MEIRFKNLEVFEKLTKKWDTNFFIENILARSKRKNGVIYTRQWSRNKQGNDEYVYTLEYVFKKDTLTILTYNECWEKRR